MSEFYSKLAASQTKQFSLGRNIYGKEEKEKEKEEEEEDAKEEEEGRRSYKKEDK